MPIMKDGFPTIFVDLGGGEGVLFYEKRVKPPSASTGAKIDTSGMRNVRMATSWPQALIECGDITTVIAWDPMYWNTLMNLLSGFGGGNLGRKPRFMQLRYPPDPVSTIARFHNFYGTIFNFDPSEHVRGTQPEATLGISVHNVNELGAETIPSVS